MSSRLSRLLRQHRALANSSPQELVMQRITLAPVAGATGNTKAVKRPETFAAALELALEKEVLAGGAKPARLFFPDGGEIEADSWEWAGGVLSDQVGAVNWGVGERAFVAEMALVV